MGRLMTGDVGANTGASLSAVYRSAKIAAENLSLRSKSFPDGLFFDPRWSMMLDLFVSEALGVKISVSSLCIAARVPPTTALRHISFLREKGLIEKTPDDRDLRRTWLDLSHTGRQLMLNYFERLALRDQADAPKPVRAVDDIVIRLRLIANDLERATDA